METDNLIITEAYSFYENVISQETLNIEHLLGVSPPLNVKIESTETIIDII